MLRPPRSATSISTSMAAAYRARPRQVRDVGHEHSIPWVASATRRSAPPTLPASGLTFAVVGFSARVRLMRSIRAVASNFSGSKVRGLLIPDALDIAPGPRGHCGLPAVLGSELRNSTTAPARPPAD
jgi:hypothetical protein